MIVFNRLLNGWFVVRGRHHFPLHGPYASKQEAKAAIVQRQLMRDGAQQWGNS